MKKCNRAFSMIELVAAVVIVGVMAVSIMNLYSFGGRMNSLLQEDLIVANLLQYKIEEIQCQPFTKDVAVLGQVISPFMQYKIDVTQTTSYLGNVYLKKIHVVCIYPSAVGVTRQEQIDFLVADNS